MRSTGRLGAIAYFGGLVAVWLALWGGLSWANLLSGSVVAGLVTRAVNRPDRHRWETIRPIAAVRLLVWFSWKLVVASMVVSWDIVTPTQRARQGVIAIELRSSSDRVTAIIANIISLTPGSLTLEIAHDDHQLFVHVLHLNDREEVVADIARLESLVISAFGPTSDAAVPEPTLSSSPRRTTIDERTQE